MIKNILKFIYGKLLPLSLSAAMLFECGPSALAQQYDYKIAQDKTRVAQNIDSKLIKAYGKASLPAPISYEQARAMLAKEDKAGKLTEKDYTDLYNQYLKNVAAQDANVSAVYKKLSKEINLSGDLDYAFRESRTSGKVCEGKECYDIQDYAQGFLRARLYDAAGLRDGTSSKYRWNGEIMLEAIPDIYYAYYNYGIHRSDEQFLQKYLRFLIDKADDYCDNDTYLADIAPGAAGADGRTKAWRGKARRQKECESIGKAMILLGIASESGKDKIENSKLIYEATEDTYKDDYGAITLTSGISALMAIGTKGSYYYIDKLLTEDSLHAGQNFGTVKNGFFWFMDLLSVESWIEKGTDINNRSRGRGGRYLNPLTAMFQYVDEDAARDMGISSFSVSVAKDHPGLGYNIPYRNVFEDLGIMIASTGTVQGNAIASKIINGYTAALKENGNRNRSANTALVTGVLEAGTIKSDAATYAAKKLNSLDWWDLNEATQRRINNAAAKYAGTVKRSKDQAKIKRNETNTKIINAGVWTDMLVSAVFIMSLVVSLPGIVKSAGTLARNVSRIRAIKAAGKANLLKVTRARIAALPVKPVAVKNSLSVKKPAVKAADVKVAEPKPVVKNTAVKEMSIKPSSVKSGQIQYSLTEQSAAESFITNNQATLTATVGEGGGGAYASAAAKVKKVLTPKIESPEPVISPQNSAPVFKARKPTVPVELQRAKIYKNRSLTEKLILGKKFYGELSPFQKTFIDFKVKASVVSDLTSDFVRYGLKDPKAYVAPLIPAVTTVQAAASAPIVISRTIEAMPSALKTMMVKGPSEAVKILDEATSVAAKLPQSPVKIPSAASFFGPEGLVAIRPQDMIVAALPQASFSSKQRNKKGLIEKVSSLFAYNGPLSENGRIMSKKRAFSQIKQSLKAETDKQAFQGLADKLMAEYPQFEGKGYIYRGMFLSSTADLSNILKNGLEMDKIVSKPMPVAGTEITTIHGERENICFAEDPAVAMSYATGINMFSNKRRGYITMVVATHPKDLNTKDIWFLSRNMRADEMIGLYVYDMQKGKWLPASDFIVN